MPRILLISPVVAPPAGGIATYTLGVRRGLLGVGRVGLVAMSLAPVGAVRGSITASGEGPLAHLAGRVRFVTSVVVAVLRGRPDVVHAVTWRAALPVALLPSRFRPTLIVTALGTELIRNPLAGPARDLVFRRADSIIAISRYTSRVVQTLTGRLATVIPPSVSALTTPGSTGTSRSDSGPIHVLSVGRLVARKGHCDLLVATHQARSNGATCRLKIVGGDGPERERVLELARALNATDWFDLEVDVSEQRLAVLYADADVFALMTRDAPGEFEGFGIVFAEAGLAGLPIVAGRSGGSQDAVKDGKGAYVVSTVAEAAEALTELILRPALRRQMSAESRRHAETFLPESVDRQLDTFYHSLTASRRGAPVARRERITFLAGALADTMSWGMSRGSRKQRTGRSRRP